MMNKKITNAFENLNAEHLPDIHIYDDEKLQVFWVLYASKLTEMSGILSSGEISEILRDFYGISVPRQRILALLLQEKGTVAKRRIGGKICFQLMQSGIELLDQSSKRALFIEPDSAFSAIRAIEEIFENLKGELRVCDPYRE